MPPEGTLIAQLRHWKWTRQKMEHVGFALGFAFRESFTRTEAFNFSHVGRSAGTSSVGLP